MTPQRGERGEKGERGVSASKPFVAIVLVCFAVLCVQGWQINENRHIARTNQTLIRQTAQDGVKISQLRKAQAESCENFETLRSAVNDFHGTIRRLLVGLRRTDEQRAKNIRNPKLKAADRQSVRQMDHLLAHIETVTASCAQKR